MWLRDAGQAASRSACLTLRVGVEPAIAEPRPFIAGEAEGVMRAERARGCACARHECKCGESERQCGDNGERSSSSQLNAPSRECARDVVTRSCNLSRAADNGTTENTCFK